MKKQIVVLLLLVSMLVTSCSSIFKKNQGVTGDATKKQDGAEAKLEQVDDKTANVNVKRLDKIGEMSYATDVALNKSNGVPAAIEINKRVEALANQPSIEAMKQMEAMVNQLLTNNATILEKKDKEITALGIELKNLQIEKQKAIDNQIKVAEANAAKADKLKATLDDMDSWMGLGAVWYGLTKFVTSSAWILGIGSILFLILRLASLSNPIAASIFSIFNRMGSWIVNTLAVIFPKAIEMAGHTTTSLFNAYKSTLTKIVDAIEMEKSKADAAGRTTSIADMLDEISKSMNGDEKDIVTELKRTLNWKTPKKVSSSLPEINLINK